jgi:osmotically-inducible protein OsmY
MNAGQQARCNGAQHRVTVTIKDGAVTLSGMVFDDWDLRTARRIAKRIPGVKRVINDLEIKLGGE